MPLRICAALGATIALTTTPLSAQPKRAASPTNPGEEFQGKTLSLWIWVDPLMTPLEVMRLQLSDPLIERLTLITKPPPGSQPALEHPSRPGDSNPEKTRAITARWVLRNTDGAVLAGGHTLPTPEVLQAYVEAEEGPSRIVRLQRFLARHPQHWEARLALLQHLRGTLKTKLGLLKAWRAEASVREELDQAIWGALSNELEATFQEVDWVASAFALDPFMPTGLPERESPLMMALYQRLRPKTLEVLKAIPDDPSAWSALMRMNLALGEMVWPPLESLAFRLYPPRALAPLLWGAKRISDELLPQERHEESIKILRWIWMNQCLPSLMAKAAAMKTDSAAPRGATTASSIEEAERERYWTALLKPLLTSCIRTNRMGELRSLLGTLGPESSGIVTPLRIRNLLGGLGRPDLQTQLLGFLPVPPPPEPQPENPLRDGVSTSLIVRDQPPPPFLTELKTVVLQAYGSTIRAWNNPIPEPAARDLNWPSKGPRWAVMGPDGRVLAEGGVLPSGHELVGMLRRVGVTFREEDLLGHLTNKPEELGPIASLATLAGAQLQAFAAIAASGHPELNPSGTIGGFPDSTDTLRRSWDHILGSSLGITRDVLIHAGLAWPRDRKRKDLDPIWDALGSSHLGRVEEAIRRRPSDAHAWQVWLNLSPPDPKLATSLFSQLIQPPLVQHAWIWPSASVHEAIARSFLAAESWDEAIAWLQPRWHEMQREGTEGTPTPPWTPVLSRQLHAALLSSGRLQEAEEVLSAPQKRSPSAARPQALSDQP